MKRTAILLAALALVGAACTKSPSNVNSTVPSTNSEAVNGTERTGTASVNGSTNVSTATNGSDVLRTAIVKLTANGTEPKELRVLAGTVVAFVNEDSVGHWIASNPHPSHSGLPGFDAGSAVAPEATYTFTFSTGGAWGYHDHLDATNAKFSGSVVVTAP